MRFAATPLERVVSRETVINSSCGRHRYSYKQNENKTKTDNSTRISFYAASILQVLVILALRGMERPEISS
jgi:hypothetical protein